MKRPPRLTSPLELLLLLSLLLAPSSCREQPAPPARQPVAKPDPQPTSTRRDRANATAGYYAQIDARDAAQLRHSVHAAIQDHRWLPYHSQHTDTWTVLLRADTDPKRPGYILDLYRNGSYAEAPSDNPDYNREHAWPRSYGFPKPGRRNYPHNDCHHLFLAHHSYNSSRGNRPYNDCDQRCTEKPTEPGDPAVAQRGAFPGHSNWRSPQGWQVWQGRQGDVARALLYLDVRYEGGHHRSGAAEPDLILTDDLSLVQPSHANVDIAYMGRLHTLLRWHHADPVSAAERSRNDVIYRYQGNRNPFIDHPEWVDCIWSDVCPAAPACRDGDCSSAITAATTSS